MKISLQWLKDYVPNTLSAEKLAHKLTMAGLEVEHVEGVGSDVALELEITPNRPDCLSMLGIAREVSAILNKPFKISGGIKGAAPKILKAKSVKTLVAIENKKDCSRYIGTVIEGVRVEASPDGVARRLAALGLRSINNIVDITNFCLMESGQPLHAFDFDKLEGGRILVRRAKAGERIVTLDGVERTLDSSILVIADAKRPVAIAGIMGGKDTEVTQKTENILLESAYFDPILIRRASRTLGLGSDSSYRFERGVDFDGVGRGAARAIGLIQKFAGGHIQAQQDVRGSQKKTRRRISLNNKDIEGLLGARVGTVECRRILKQLGFEVSGTKDTLRLTVPAFRGDIRDPVDIIEEIGRIIGYDNLPMSLPRVALGSLKEDRQRKAREDLRQRLLAQGLNEVITYTMTSGKDLEKCRIDNTAAVKVKNPLTLDQALMRPSLAPAFLPVLLSNINRGQKDLRFFEIGKIYSPQGERETLALALAGQRYDDWRRSKSEAVDFYDIKGAVESVIVRAGGPGGHSFKAFENPFFEKGAAAELLYNGKHAGVVGEISREVLAAWDIKRSGIFFAEIDIEHLFAQGSATKTYHPISEYPAVVLDISLAVKDEVLFAQIQEIVDELRPDFLKEVSFNELYLGEKIPSGHRGLVISLTYQSPARTLRDDEALAAHEKICQALTQRLGAVRR